MPTAKEFTNDYNNDIKSDNHDNGKSSYSIGSSIDIDGDYFCKHLPSPP